MIDSEESSKVGHSRYLSKIDLMELNALLDTVRDS